MEKPNNIIEISTSIKDLFRYWFMFLEPLHNLTNREIDVITAIVRNRYELSKVRHQYHNPYCIFGSGIA